MGIGLSIRCLSCGKQITYVRLKTGEGICVTCGTIMPPEEVKAQREAQAKPPKAQGLNKD